MTPSAPPVDPLAFLREVAGASYREAGNDYRELCLGIEVALAMLAEGGRALDRLALDFGRDGVRIAEASFLDAVPEDYQVEGVWLVLFTATMPRHGPLGGEPLRARRLEIGYRRDPVVYYDGQVELGLPLRLDRPYDPSKFKARDGAQT